MPEIDELYSRKRQEQNKINQCENNIAQIERKIERLKNYKRKTEDYKSSIYRLFLEYSNNKSNISSSKSISELWQGDKYNEVVLGDMEDLDSEIINFYRKIDDLLDSVCDEINRLKGQVYEQQDIIGYIKNVIDDIGNEIEKFFN